MLFQQGRTFFIALGSIVAFSSWTSASFASGAAPRIGGTPATVARVGDAYGFRPTASDAEHDALTFSISGRPAWAEFNRSTGRLYGTPRWDDVGQYGPIVIKVSDGTSTRALPGFSITVKSATTTQRSTSTSSARKASYGHYFAARYQDTPDDVATLCEQSGIQGVMIRRTWSQLEPRPGDYDFSAIEQALRAIANSRKPQCQIWLFVDFKSFRNSPIKNPCPPYLQARYSARNTDETAYTCFMWDANVGDRYIALMRAIADRYDGHPRFEGFVIQESALGFNGRFSQDVGDGGTYTGARWRDALVRYVRACGSAFQQSRCMSFLNFIRNGQEYLDEVSSAISAVPDNRACMSGPDVLPDEKSLYDSRSAVYEVLTRHRGCRANSAQNDSFEIYRYGLGQVFDFAVGGEFGDFNQSAPRASGLCVNSYLFWNHRIGTSWTGLDWHDVLPVVDAYPYGRMWLDRCAGGGGVP
jgi:hypothetical protein